MMMEMNGNDDAVAASLADASLDDDDEIDAAGIAAN